jgi:GET complex subunit GET2
MGGGSGLGGNDGDGADGDPLTAMLSQMMQSMGGGAGAPGGPGGPGGGFTGMPGMPGLGAAFPGFPGFPGMGAPGQQQQAPAKPSTSAALWRLVHFTVAFALGLYVALATPFTGTRIERDNASAQHTTRSDGVVYGSTADDFALHKRYFFYAFATAETILLTSRIFLERGGSSNCVGGGGAGGIIGMAMGLLPPTIKRNVEIATRYWQIFSTVRSDLLVCVFVLGVCSWLRS